MGKRGGFTDSRCCLPFTWAQDVVASTRCLAGSGANTGHPPSLVSHLFGRDCDFSHKPKLTCHTHHRLCKHFVKKARINAAGCRPTHPVDFVCFSRIFAEKFGSRPRTCTAVPTVWPLRMGPANAAARCRGDSPRLFLARTSLSRLPWLRYSIGILFSRGQRGGRWTGGTCRSQGGGGAGTNATTLLGGVIWSVSFRLSATRVVSNPQRPHPTTSGGERAIARQSPCEYQRPTCLRTAADPGRLASSGGRARNNCCRRGVGASTSAFFQPSVSIVLQRLEKIGGGRGKHLLPLLVLQVVELHQRSEGHEPPLQLHLILGLEVEPALPHPEGDNNIGRRRQGSI